MFFVYKYVQENDVPVYLEYNEFLRHCMRSSEQSKRSKGLHSNKNSWKALFDDE